MTTALSQLAIVLRTYGFLGAEHSSEALADRLCLGVSPGVPTPPGVQTHREVQPQLYYPWRRWYGLAFLKPPVPVYHALLPHVTFTGETLRPVWVNQAGRAVIAWHQEAGRQMLLIGLDIEEEIVRHRQGDPAKVDTARVKGGFGFDFERPNYLFEDQVLAPYRTVPWADHLGFFLAETLAQLSGWPLVEPLPGGARAAVMLTGDDDQALLEKYAEQLQTIGHVPITYFLHPLTRHTRETLEKLPPHVELGVHPDALEHPEEYDQLCTEQAQQIRQLSGKPVRIVRNHGYLNRGYLGHLPAWEQNGLTLDVNSPGVDGTALTASFLPMRLRRVDGTWSAHYSLLTLFGDGMLYALKLDQRQAVARIRQLARQVEKSYAGVVVFNFHPQNIADTRHLHQAVLELTRRRGWIALGLESYLSWLEILESLHLQPLDDRNFLLTASGAVRDLVLRYAVGGAWRSQKLKSWVGQIHVCLA